MQRRRQASASCRIGQRASARVQRDGRSGKRGSPERQRDRVRRGVRAGGADRSRRALRPQPAVEPQAQCRCGRRLHAVGRELLLLQRCLRGGRRRGAQALPLPHRTGPGGRREGLRQGKPAHGHGRLATRRGSRGLRPEEAVRRQRRWADLERPRELPRARPRTAWEQSRCREGRPRTRVQVRRERLRRCQTPDAKPETE